MSKGNKVSVSQKCQKEMPDFCDAVASLSVDELNARLAQLAKDAEQVRQAKEADDDLAEAQEKATLLAAPYRDGKKAIQLKTSYLISLIKDKGGDA